MTNLIECDKFIDRFFPDCIGIRDGIYICLARSRGVLVLGGQARRGSCTCRARRGVRV